METPKVIIKDNFSDFLEGKVVNAQPANNAVLHEGEKVIAVKDSIAGITSVPVPPNEIHRAMGIDAVVVGASSTDQKKSATVPNLLLKVKKY
jgi:hypothetical protein